MSWWGKNWAGEFDAFIAEIKKGRGKKADFVLAVPQYSKYQANLVIILELLSARVWEAC